MKTTSKKSNPKANELKKYIDLAKFESDEFKTTIIVGARGVGKTIGAFKRYLLLGFEQDCYYIYLRRYQTEIDTLGINTQLLSKLTGHEIRREKVPLDSGQQADMITVDDQPVMYLVALSVAGKYKSNSWGNVVKVIYDEFIDYKGRELKGETKLFISFMQTVFRDFSKYSALFLANATNMYNNYFLDWEVMPARRITKFRKKGIKIVMYKTSDELAKEHEQSQLGQLIRLTEGQDSSSLDNIFDNGYNDFLAKLDRSCQQRFTFYLAQDAYGYWIDENNNPYLSRKYSKDVKAYALTSEDIRENAPLIPYDLYVQIRTQFERASLMFTDTRTRSMMIKFFKSGRLWGFEA